MLKKKYKTYVLVSMITFFLFLSLIMNFNCANSLGEIYAKPMSVFQYIPVF